jgi:putative redox protein
MGKTAAAFTVNAKGVRRDAHPTCFETIDLEFIIHSKDTAAADVQKAITMSEDKICPVWAMIKDKVQVKTTVQIIAE